MPLTPNTNPTSPESANPETLIAEFKKLGGKFLAKGHRSTWSPDGKKIAFGKGPRPTGIVVLDLDSGRTTQTDSGKDPSWSGGDGRWIAYMTGDGETEQVWVMLG